MIEAARLLLSTKTARSAPRLSASIPAAPTPANRSRKPSDSKPSDSSDAKSACFTRSDRGRVSAGAAASRTPRAVPAITRPASGIGVLRERFACAHARQPADGHLALEAGQGRRQSSVVVQQLLGHLARLERQL